MVIGRPNELTFCVNEKRQSVYYHRIAKALAHGTSDPNGDMGLFSIGNWKTAMARDYDELKKHLEKSVRVALNIHFCNAETYDINDFSFTFRYEEIEDNEFWHNLSYCGECIHFKEEVS